MDKLSDYIPLIVILIGFIISAIRGSKKKKAAHEMTKTMLPKGVYSENKPSPESSPIPIFQQKKESRTEKKNRRPITDYIVDNPEVKRSIVTLYEEDQSAEDQLDNSDNFDLNLSDISEWKRAVIYSEILQRKTD